MAGVFFLPFGFAGLFCWSINQHESNKRLDEKVLYQCISRNTLQYTEVPMKLQESDFPSILFSARAQDE